MKLKPEIFEQLQEQLHNTFAALFGGEASTNEEAAPTPESVDLNSFKVAELKAMAKERGFKGYTGFRKAQLIEMLQQN